MLPLLIALLLAPALKASFCGPAAVPFSFEALPDGQPVLGCARPTCFGWNAAGKPAGSPSLFYRVNKKPDGYFRKNAEIQVRNLNENEAQFFQAQTANCAATYDSDQCASETQWVGGIGPLSNVTGLPLALQCCDYDPLLLSQDRGIAAVKPGQIVIGGEILSGERQYAFDYISDIVKNVSKDGTVAYDVYVRRLPCLPQPSEVTVSVERSVYAEIGNRFDKKSKHDRKGSKAYQAPLQEFGENSNIALESLNNNEVGTGARNVVDNQEGGQEVQSTGQIVSQSERVILEPTGQETVQVVQGQAPVAPNSVGGGGETVVQGPFVADGEADEVVDAIQGLELPEGQVPAGLVESAPAAPAYSGGYGGGYGAGGGGGGSAFCFSADTMVTMADGTTKRMDELNVNDWVLSANQSSQVQTPVESWIHRMPNQEAEFLKIQLEDGKSLKITDKHYIYKTKCTKQNQPLKFYEVSIKPVYAEQVTVGECLYVYEDDVFVQKQVTMIEKIVETGIYAPMTANGDIIVNGIFASCYNILNSSVMQKTFFNSFKNWPSFMGQQNEVDLPIFTHVVLELMEYVLPKTLL
ncbi:unnamed protein product [Bursaphelenchus okinawaensis]|uniref:Uncharacterized protein n=1 Tax=Bursaphelenchus okinawaensis TaxID=465554 RepID=A0A811LIU4_9BILA|nr:unnamed protein product [Bursaphelenchus okinawaensis]CAG9123391.1 unnamed protein product [Bursaphelenchus okinawaensis]